MGMVIKMFGIFKSKASKENVNEYGVMLANHALNNNLNIDTAKSLYEYATEHNFTAEQIGEAQKLACCNTWSNIMNDYTLNDEEKAVFEKLLNICTGLPVDEKNYWLNKIHLHHTLYEIEHKDTLPIYDPSEVNILFKNKEVLHFSSSAQMMKKKRVTRKVSYSGPVASIKICKGLRYRIGSVHVSRSVEEFWTVEDTGTFWISNMRIGFIGDTKNFVFPLAKLLSLTDGESGLNIFKEGRTNPFIVSMPDYELPCAILSKLINEMDW